MAIDVFVSVGRPATDSQERFVSQIEARLRASGFNPRTVGRNAFSSQQPLHFIAELMKECKGSVIIAFERVHIGSGLERTGSKEEAALSNPCLPTVWGVSRPEQERWTRIEPHPCGQRTSRSGRSWQR
jgi:hypothetical protein